MLRRLKGMREGSQSVRAKARQTVSSGRAAGSHMYAGAVRTVRYWKRVERQALPRLTQEIHVRRGLRAVAKAQRPIIVGPWLSEVGYEILYWIPFLRWFCDRYDVDRSRLVVVSRGDVATWYKDIAQHYIELLDLLSPTDLASHQGERHRAGNQKQYGVESFDQEILARIRATDWLAEASICHPSVMFRLLRQFWLGNESLRYAQEHMKYAMVDLPPSVGLPPLPDNFVAVKFYTSKALPDTIENRRALRGLVERLATEHPVVTLDTGLALDEHQDYLFRDISGVMNLSEWLTPRNNLAVQTMVIAKAKLFVGTCGSVTWLAPFLGIDTLAVYTDDHLLTSHLYAARHAYRAAGAATFKTLDLSALRFLDKNVVRRHEVPR